MQAVLPHCGLAWPVFYVYCALHLPNTDLSDVMTWAEAAHVLMTNNHMRLSWSQKDNHRTTTEPYLLMHQNVRKYILLTAGRGSACDVRGRVGANACLVCGAQLCPGP